MAGNTFGTQLRLTTWGESHGPAVGGVLDGFPAGIPLDLSAVDAELDRRKPRGAAGTPRRESDAVEWLSGLHPEPDAQGRRLSLGTPIAFLVRNSNTQSGDYTALADVFRPGHADATYQAKYGIRDVRGGGRSSARETVARVIAGALAKQLLGPSVTVRAAVERAAGISASDPSTWDWALRDQSAVGCPDLAASAAIEEEVARRRREGDSAGGVVYLEVLGVSAGWGEPVFDKLHAVLGHALLSINDIFLRDHINDLLTRCHIQVVHIGIEGINVILTDLFIDILADDASMMLQAFYMLTCNTNNHIVYFIIRVILSLNYSLLNRLNRLCDIIHNTSMNT